MPGAGDRSASIGFPSAAMAACCAAVYGHPFAALVVGESFHPGGLRSTRELLDAARTEPGMALLDVGTGLGASARLARDERGLVVTGIDLSRGVLKQAAERTTGGGITWQRADATSLPFTDGAFDIVLAECVLSSIPAARGLSEIARVLRPGGRLAFSDVRRSGRPVAALEEHPLLGSALCVSTAWTAGELEATAAAAGLRLIRSWDRDEAIVALLERIEGRMTIARDLLSGTAAPDGPDGAFAAIDSASVKRLVASVRESVEAGDLGYVGAIIERPA